jgi:hypothetical protein
MDCDLPLWRRLLKNYFRGCAQPVLSVRVYQTSFGISSISRQTRKSYSKNSVEHVRTYSPQSDASVNEVFQGIMQLLHNAKNELELSELPRRGAWGSVTAKNFPGALSEVFEQAIVGVARKKGA